MTFDLPTFGFQIVNFIVLVLLLKRLLWGPLSSHMEKRRRRIAAGLEAVDRGRKEVTSMQQTAEEMLEQARRVGAQAKSRAEDEAAAHRERLLEEARQAASQERKRARDQLQQERGRHEAELIRTLLPEIGALAGAVCRQVGSELHDNACHRLAQEISDVSLDERASQLVVETATGTLTADLEAAVFELPHEGITISTRPDLVAGARVCIGDLVFDGSIKAQLESLLAEVEDAR